MTVIEAIKFEIGQLKLLNHDLNYRLENVELKLDPSKYDYCDDCGRELDKDNKFQHSRHLCPNCD